MDERDIRMNKLQTITMTTPDGVFHIVIDDKGVARASGFGDLQDLRKRLPAELRGTPVEPAHDHSYEAFVQAYYDGDTTALDAIPRAQNGSDFQKRVWRAISNIPYGKTISYKELASAAGNSGAVRAAGTACGLNRLILLVPCHRVLKSDGSIGNYLYGPKIKTSLLRSEQAAAKVTKPISTQ